MALEDVIRSLIVIARCRHRTVVDEDGGELLTVLAAEVTKCAIRQALEDAWSLFRAKVEHFGE